MKTASKCAALVLAACLSGVPAWAQIQSLGQAAADAESLMECVDAKAGPEGDLPSSGPIRDQIVTAMAGGPQACVGRVYEACMKLSEDATACNRRESSAWLAAIAVSPEDRKRFPRKNITIYTEAVGRVQAQARALCRAAAAVSAWGSEAITDGSFEKRGYNNYACEREAIAQQALVVLVASRGN
ncbi:MAG: hypothetical protein K2Y29_21150 [Beijerinckiaceae bacterium]|nr:hypothetical protein [Beijerinckiaceae bacterium]